MKHILVGVLVCRPPSYKLQIQSHKLQIREGTRCSDVLAHLKAKLNWLSDSRVLARASDPITFFHSEEDLYAAVENNTKLIALPPIEAARLGLADMLKNSPLKDTIR